MDTNLWFHENRLDPRLHERVLFTFSPARTFSVLWCRLKGLLHQLENRGNRLSQNLHLIKNEHKGCSHHHTRTKGIYSGLLSLLMSFISLPAYVTSGCLMKFAKLPCMKKGFWWRFSRLHKLNLFTDVEKAIK